MMVEERIDRFGMWCAKWLVGCPGAAAIFLLILWLAIFKIWPNLAELVAALAITLGSVAILTTLALALLAVFLWILAIASIVVLLCWALYSWWRDKAEDPVQ